MNGGIESASRARTASLRRPTCSASAMRPAERGRTPAAATSRWTRNAFFEGGTARPLEFSIQPHLALFPVVRYMREAQMRIAEFLKPDAVVEELHATSKSEILRELS